MRRFGVIWRRSIRLRTPASSSVSCPIAVTAIGTSWIAALRPVAVTTISSDTPSSASCAIAGVAAPIATSDAPARRIQPNFDLLFIAVLPVPKPPSVGDGADHRHGGLASGYSPRALPVQGRYSRGEAL